MAIEIVGRDSEVAALLAFLDGVGEGPCAAVLEGEPGIGKTTIWSAGLDAARERSLRVLATRPAEAEQGLAHAGLTDLLEDCVGEVLPELAAPRRRALETALLLDDGGGATADSRALAVAVHSVLRALAERGPVLVAVDDVQWLDASSGAALAFALRRLDTEPLGVLLARRAGGQPTVLEQAVAHHGIRRLAVGPLSLGALHALLRERLGRPWPRPTMLRLHEVSGGNPFFGLELARALAAASEPLDPMAPLRVPDTLDRLVGDRLRALPQETRSALLVVAVVGAPTSALLEAAGVERKALDDAVASQVVELENGEVRFVHPLLASGVIAQAGEDERRAAHRAVAAVVEDPVARARHVAAALDEPDARVAQALEEAMPLARTRGAPSVAAELGEAAARATPPADDDDRRRRVLGAARDHLAAGSADRAFVLARDLLAESAPGRERAEALFLLGELESAAGTGTAAVEYLRDALREARGVRELEVVIHGLLALESRITEGLGVAEQHARAAVQLGADLGDDALAARSLASLAIVRYNQGEPEAFLLAERATELARRSGDSTAIDEATSATGHCLLWSGRIDDARRVFSQHLRSVAERDEPAAANALWYLALVEERASRLDRAHDHAEEARELMARYSWPDQDEEPGVLGPSARVAAFRGDVDRARELAERAWAFAEARGGSATGRANLALLGMLDHWTGEPERAVERFAAVDAARRAAGFSNSISIHVADHVEALLELDRVAEALDVLDEWESEAEKLGHLRAIAEIVRCRGLVAAARGDVTGAIGLLEDAVARHEEVGDPFGRARALLLLGVARRRARQKRPAREAIEAALAGFEAIGAAGWAEKARAELGTIGGRTREEGLTPAERRVAALVAQGRTNREVAAALVLGERTVESHLTSVYAKLGIRSRTELARRMG